MCIIALFVIFISLLNIFMSCYNYVVISMAMITLLYEMEDSEVGGMSKWVLLETQ